MVALNLHTLHRTHRSFGSTIRRDLLLAHMVVLATVSMLPTSWGYESTEVCVADAVELEGAKAGLRCQTWRGTTAEDDDIEGLDACLTFCCEQRFQVTHVHWQSNNKACECGVCAETKDEGDEKRHLYLLDPGVPGIASCAAGQYNSDGHTTSVPPLLPCLEDRWNHRSSEIRPHRTTSHPHPNPGTCLT